MKLRLRMCFLGGLVAVVTGCGSMTYQPRPSPRIQIVPEGSSLALLKNGQRYQMGMFGSGLEEAVAGNARAEDEAKSYTGKTTAAFVLSLLGTGATAGGSALVVEEAIQHPNGWTSLDNAGLGLMIGGLVVAITGSFLQASAQPHLWNAINIYNDGLPPGAGGSAAPAPGLYPQGYPAPYAPPGFVPPGYPGAAPPAPLPPPAPR